MTLLRRHPFLMLAFALALAVTLFFAGRFAVQVVYWSNPAHQNQQVQGWMTVGYIGKSWRLPPREIDAVAGLPVPERGKPFTLDQIARDRGIPVAEVISQVEQAIAVLLARRLADEARAK
ncbi:MAG: hypothetical protein ACK4MS_09330 [Paracoccaceae bacterium]